MPPPLGTFENRRGNSVASPSNVPSAVLMRPQSQPVTFSLPTRATGRGGFTWEAPGRARAACSLDMSPSFGVEVHIHMTVGRSADGVPRVVTGVFDSVGGPGT
jgi:hypothetical protein